MGIEQQPPETYKALYRSSPFLDLLGPLYQREQDGQLIVALRIGEKHINARGFAHGGLYMSLADVALGYSMAWQELPDPTSRITTSMSIDFAGSAKLGDWLEAHVDIQKTGRQVSFANTYLTVGDKRIVRASAVFTTPIKTT